MRPEMMLPDLRFPTLMRHSLYLRGGSTSLSGKLKFSYIPGKGGRFVQA